MPSHEVGIRSQVNHPHTCSAETPKTQSLQSPHTLEREREPCERELKLLA